MAEEAAVVVAEEVEVAIVVEEVEAGTEADVITDGNYVCLMSTFLSRFFLAPTPIRV